MYSVFKKFENLKKYGDTWNDVENELFYTRAVFDIMSPTICGLSKVAVRVK